MRVSPERFLTLLLFVCLLVDDTRGEGVGAVSVSDPALVQAAWANGNSLVADISADGRYVVILSSASNLAMVPTPHGVMNVYLRDRANDSMVLVSQSPEGNGGGNDHSTGARITPDGGHIVFQSWASDLVENDGNAGEDVFLWDATTRSSRLASVSAAASRSGNGWSSAPVLTPDGRYVAFVSAASDLVTGDANEIPDVFVRDIQGGVTWLVSAGATRIDHGLSGSRSPVITADGRYVAFESLAHGLVTGAQLAASQVYLRDLTENRTAWISRDVTNYLGEASVRCYNAVLSEDGRFVAFKTGPGGSGWPKPAVFRHEVEAGVTELVANDAVGNDISLEDDSGPAMTPDGRLIALTRRPLDGPVSDVYVWDAELGDSELVSINLQGTGGGDGSSDTPWISADGRYAGFLSSATNLVATVADGVSSCYLRDRALGVTRLLSTDATGEASGGQDVVTPVFSADTTLAAFDVFDDRLVTGDWNDVSDVFGWETNDSSLSLLSGALPELRSITGSGQSWSADHSLSADGRYVVFVSEAEDLVPNDSNGASDVFIRDLESGTTVLVSVNVEGTGSGNQASANPSISADGRRVAFASYACDLVSNDANDREDVFVRDWVAGTTVLASVSLSGGSTIPRVPTQPLISPDGRYVAFASRSTELVNEPLVYTINLYARDLESGTTQLITRRLPGTALSSPLFSGVFFPSQADVVLFEAKSSLFQFVYRVDLVNGTAERIDLLAPGEMFDGPYSYSFNVTSSDDGQRAIFVSASPDLVGGDVNEKQDVFLRDLSIPSTRLISVNTNGVGGNGDALEATVSEDGQWVAFTSTANDLTPGDANRGGGTEDPGNPDRDVFLHDLARGATQLISRSYLHGGSANGPSDSPVVSADGRYVAFRSVAQDLVPYDFNSSADVFVYDRQTSLITMLSVSASGPFAADQMSQLPTISTDGSVTLFNSWAGDLIVADHNTAADVFWARTAITGGPSSLVAGIEAIPGDQVRIGWSAAPGLTYGVQYREDLTGSDWIALPGQVVIEGDRAMMDDPEPAMQRHRYYRVFLVH